MLSSVFTQGPHTRFNKPSVSISDMETILDFWLIVVWDRRTSSMFEPYKELGHGR